MKSKSVGVVQKGFRMPSVLSDDFSELCRRFGMSESQCLNRLCFLFVCNDGLLQSRCTDSEIVARFVDSYV